MYTNWQGKNQPLHLLGLILFCGLGDIFFDAEITKEVEATEEAFAIRVVRRLLLGFLKGHGTIKRHLHELMIVDNAICRFCGDEEETPQHLLMNSDAESGKRARSLGQYQMSLEVILKVYSFQVLDFLKLFGLNVSETEFP